MRTYGDLQPKIYDYSLRILPSNKKRTTEVTQRKTAFEETVNIQK